MLHKKSEKGQAIILIVFALIGLIGITGLTVDGGLAYGDRRHAQNAADSAAFAAALANSKNADVESAAQSIATANGYNDDGIQNEVVITYVTSPAGTCPYEFAGNKDITVEITSHLNTYFAPIVGIRTMTNKVFATTRACGTYIAPIFGGNAIVSLNPDPDTCAFTSDTGSAEWAITGGGIFSNGCAVGKDNITLDEDHCVGAVEGVEGMDDIKCSTPAAPYDQTYIDDIMPPNPCGEDGEGGDAGEVGLLQPHPIDKTVLLKNGVYCISDFDDYDSTDIILENATLYVTDEEFNLKFSGGGGFSGTPTVTGDYSSYYMVIAPLPKGDECDSFTSNTTQVVNYRGNGSGEPYGTILAPTACVDLRGNGTADINGQVIGYNVSANGDANTSIHYVDDQNRRDPVKPTIELIK